MLNHIKPKFSMNRNLAKTPSCNTLARALPIALLFVEDSDCSCQQLDNTNIFGYLYKWGIFSKLCFQNICISTFFVFWIWVGDVKLCDIVPTQLMSIYDVYVCFCMRFVSMLLYIWCACVDVYVYMYVCGLYKWLYVVGFGCTFMCMMRPTRASRLSFSIGQTFSRSCARCYSVLISHFLASPRRHVCRQERER